MMDESTTDGSMMDESTEDLGSAPLLPLLVKLSIPGIVGMLVMSLYNIVDTYWVSGLADGTEAIAALTILFPIHMVASALALGTGVGVSSLVARRSGEGRHEAVADAGGQGITFPLLVGVVMMVVCAAIPRKLAVIFGAPAEVVEYTAGYLKVLAFGFPPMFVVMSFNGFYRGLGNTVTPMFVMIVSAGVNMIVDPFLIYGWGPLPEMGIEGAGLSTVIAEIAAVALSMGYLISGSSPYKISLHHLRLQLPMLRDIAQVGAPAAFMSFLRPLMGVAFNWALHGFGAQAIAAQGIGMRVMGLMIPLVIGFHQGLLPIVGYTFGANNYRRMWDAVKKAAASTAALGALIAMVLWFAAPAVAGLFTDEPELIALAVVALHIKVIGMPIMAPTMMGVGMLEGIGKGFRALLLSLTRQLLFVLPLLFILPKFWGVVGVFASQPLATFLSLGVTAAFLYREYRLYPPGEMACGQAPADASD